MPKSDVLLVIDSEKSARSSVGNFVLSSGSSGGGSVGDLSSYLRRDGTSVMMGNLDMGGFSVLNVAFLDGVDLPAHVANNNAHHNQIHTLEGTDHTGLLPWERLNFINSELVDVQVRPHNALQEIGPNDHHNQVHNIVGSDHTVTGLVFDIVGLTANNVLGLHTPSFNPGATAKLLKTDVNGALIIKRLEGTDFVKSSAYVQAATYVQAGSYMSAVTYVDTPIVQQAGNISINAGINILLNPATYVAVAANKSIRSNSFVSGFLGDGWQIDQGVTAPGTNAEFDNLTIRGRMRVYELLIQRIRATNGSIFVSSVGKAATVTLISGDNYTITTEDDHGFLENDLIRAQQFTGNVPNPLYRCDMRVTAVTTLKSFTAIRENASDLPKIGMDFVRIGNTADWTRRGGLYLSSDDSNAPFMDVFDGVNSWAAWTTTGKVKVRIGKISGVTSNAGEYGIVAGTNGFGNDATWFKASNYGVIFNNIPLSFYNGANWTGYWSPSGQAFWIGTNENDRRINWNGTTLAIRGQITIEAGGNAATTTDVSTAQTTAINYTINNAANLSLSNTSANWAASNTKGGRIVMSVQAPLITDNTVVHGLNLNSTHMGFYNSTLGAWTVFMKNDGTFRFGSSNVNNRIEWNGNELAAYNSAGTLQWYASANDGYIYAGGGYVLVGNFGIIAGTYTSMNQSGVNIFATGVASWVNPVTISIARTYSFTNDLGSQAASFGAVYVNTNSANPREGIAYMHAYSYSSGNTLLASSHLRVTANGGLYFNDNAVWHNANQGSGSGLDADLLDGVHASVMARNNISQTFFGNQTVSGYLYATSYVRVGTTLWLSQQFSTPSAASGIVQIYMGGDGNVYLRGVNGYARLTGFTVLSGSFP